MAVVSKEIDHKQVKKQDAEASHAVASVQREEEKHSDSSNEPKVLNNIS